jgi:hypothetical protein
MLLREVITVHCENNVKYINTLCVQNTQVFNIKANGICNYECTLKARLKKAVDFLLIC